MPPPSDPGPWVRLSRTGLAARRLNTLLQQFGSAQAIFSASTQELAAAPGMTPAAAEKLHDPEAERIDEDLRLIERLGIRLLVADDPGYPPLLKQIFDPPAFLFVRGTLGEGDPCAVAMGGSRRCSQYARSVAEKMARDLASAGISVVSGLARG